MAIVINGSGTVTGLAVGGLPDGTVDDGTVASGIASSKLTGALPAISGASLTGFTDAQMPTGSVLQVLETSSATDVSTTSTTLIDSGHSIAITPSSTSSKVFVQMTFNANVTSDANGMRYALYRGSTKIGDEGIAYITTAGSNTHFPTSLQQLDSPSSTSAVTYKLYIRSNSGDSVRLAGDWGYVRIAAMEVAG